MSDILTPLSFTALGQMAPQARWRLEGFHSDENACLYWVTRGQIQSQVAGVPRACGVNSLLYVPPNVTQRIVLGTGAFATLIKLRPIPDLVLPEDVAHIRLMDVRRQQPFLALMEGAQRELATEGPSTRQAALGYAHLFAAWLTREWPDTPSEDATQRLVQAYFGLLEARYAGGANVTSMAKELAVTPTHLTRACNAMSGMSAHNILTERLLREARELLADTDLPVSRVGVDLGYRSPAYFTRAFQAGAGMTPSAFREYARRAI